jgi:hypothetical protein
MSGGEFDFAYAHFISFAEEVNNKLNQQGLEDRYGCVEPVLPTEIEKEIREVVQLTRYVGELAKEVEWLYSGDSGNETFLKRIKEIKDRVNLQIQFPADSTQ